MGDAGAAATTEAFLASLETGADAPTEVAVTGSEEPKRKRKRWGDKVEEPGAQVAPSPGGATPDVLTATQAAAAEALKKMNEALKGGGGAGSSQCMLDIEINDCPNKAALTKKSTQQEIMEATNVSILLRGTYKPPGSTSEERAIHLHLEAATEEELGKAEQMVRSIMGPMPEPGAAAASAPPAAAGSGMGLAALDGTAAPPMSRVATAVEEASREVIEVGLDPAAGYQVRGKLLGPKGAYLKHIQDQTGIRIQLAGKGSGNMTSEGVELDAPLQLVLTGTHREGMEVARGLAEHLIKAVTEDYNRRTRPPPAPSAATPPPYGAPPPGYGGGPPPGYGGGPPPYGYGGPPPAYGGGPPPYGYAGPPPGYGGQGYGHGHGHGHGHGYGAPPGYGDGYGPPPPYAYGGPPPYGGAPPGYGAPAHPGQPPSLQPPPALVPPPPPGATNGAPPPPPDMGAPPPPPPDMEAPPPPPS